MKESEIKNLTNAELHQRIQRLSDQGQRSKAMKTLEVAFDHDFMQMMSFMQRI